MTVDTKYWTEAKASGGGRNGIAGLANGQLTVTMASPKELGGSGMGHNPEELFATGYAACYLGAMRFAAGSEKLGTVPDTATVKAHVGIGPRLDGGFGLKVKLVVSLPGWTARWPKGLPSAATSSAPIPTRPRATSRWRPRWSESVCHGAVRKLIHSRSSGVKGRPVVTPSHPLREWSVPFA